MTNATKDKFCRYYRTIVKKRNRDKANSKKNCSLCFNNCGSKKQYTVVSKAKDTCPQLQNFRKERKKYKKKEKKEKGGKDKKKKERNIKRKKKRTIVVYFYFTSKLCSFVRTDNIQVFVNIFLYMIYVCMSVRLCSTQINNTVRWEKGVG